MTINEYMLMGGTFLLSAICGLLMIPMIMRFCSRKGIYDHPDGRKVHHQNVPRLGGISFIPSMLIASSIFILINGQTQSLGQFPLSSWSMMFFISLLLVYGVGIVDDLVGLDAKAKFTVQGVAAVLIPLSGLYINNLHGLFGIHEISCAAGFILTAFILVFACNAINLIDGIDGLSGGLCLMALVGFTIFFSPRGCQQYCFLIAGLAGVLIAFLYYNIFGKVERHHKIFMGDSGSLSLGFILGFMFVKAITIEDSKGEPNPLIQTYSLLIVPTFDLIRVSVVRLRHKTHIFLADKNHIHHKLLRAGLSQHQSLGCILCLALLFILMNNVLNPHVSPTLIIAIDVVVWLLFHQALNWRLKKIGQPIFLPNTEEASYYLRPSSKKSTELSIEDIKTNY